MVGIVLASNGLRTSIFAATVLVVLAADQAAGAWMITRSMHLNRRYRLDIGAGVKLTLPA